MFELFRIMPVTLCSSAVVPILLVLLIAPTRWRRGLREALAFTEPQGQRYAVLDLCRAFAALHVFAFHLWQWNRPSMNALADLQPWIIHGSKGVPIFACLSGFLIYGICQSLKTTDEMGVFAARRVRRIYPLYALTTGILLAMNKDSLRTWVTSLLMLPVVGIGPVVNAPTWSVYAEEVFYASCFMIVGLVRLLKHKVAVLGILLFVLLFVGGGQGSRELRLWPFFLVGILAWEMRRYWGRLRPAFGWTLFVTGLLIVVQDLLSNVDHSYHFCKLFLDRVTFIPSCRSNPNIGEYTADLGVGMLLVLFAGTTTPSIDRLLKSGALRFLAAISYGIYLNQTLIINEASNADIGVGCFVALKLTAIVGLSSMTYLLVERPFLNCGRALRSEMCQSQAMRENRAP